MFEVMIEIKSAVASAADFAKNMLDPGRAVDIRLEEIESSTVNGNAVWLVTLSNIDTGGISALAAALGSGAPREYRVFTVLKATGEVLSMKKRHFAAAE